MGRFKLLLINISFIAGLSCCEEKSDVNQVLSFGFGHQTTGRYQLDENSTWPPKDSLYGLSEDYKVYNGYISAPESFRFWLQIPEGNYKIAVVLGNKNNDAYTTIRAESRRLMIHEHFTPAGTFDTLSFVVNIRSAQIQGVDSISLKPREYDYLNWDKYLTLEFAGENPSVSNVTIEETKSVPTIFLAGNSTVVDQEYEPWASWGQMFPLFLKPEVAVANYAESGETLKAFIREKRLKKIESQIKPGDYLFMEFAHNDQKPGGNHVEPYSSYQEYLMRLINVAREHKATPVLVTSTNRRAFDEQGRIVNTLEEYPGSMRQLAEREDILLIDLNQMSKDFYETLGVEGSKKAFVHYPAHSFPRQEKALADNTHFSTYGAWQLAKCVVQGIRDSNSPLKELLKTKNGSYDPNQPDAFESWTWPIADDTNLTQPEGS